MAVGGPYTPRAAGEDMTEALVMGQEQASAPVGLAPLSGPDQGQPMAQQPQQQVPQGNARFGISVQQPQLNTRRAYSAQEFYPGQERPNESRTGGGDPIWAASSGRIGWGVIADRAAEIQRQKQELKDALAKANDFSGQAAPQYEREYQKWVAQEDMRWKQDFANQYYGGDVNKAVKRLSTDPEANAMYLAHARDLKAAGIANKYYVPQAQNYVDGVLSGKVEKDPELFQAAQEMLSGGLKFSGPNTPAAALMADKGRQWEKLSSRAQLFEDTVKGRLATAVDILVKEGKVRWENGVPVVDQVEQRNFDRLIDQTAREWENQYGIDSFQINKEWLNANLGRMLKETKDFGPRPPAPSGGSDGVNANNRVVLARGTRPFFDNTRSNITQRGGTKGIDSEVVDIATQSGKQLGVLTFSDPDNDGSPVKMTPLYIQRDPVHPTQFFIVGNSATGSRTETITNADGTTTTVTVEDGGGIKDSGTDRSGTTTTDTNKQPTFTRVRVDGNENLLERVLQGQDWRSMFGGRRAAPQQASPAAADDFNARWAKLPKGGKLVGPDGVTYEKK